MGAAAAAPAADDRSLLLVDKSRCVLAMPVACMPPYHRPRKGRDEMDGLKME